MKATDYIADVIAKYGVKVVFGYQGGNIAHMIDSIGRRPDLEFVSSYNEQGASFSACGYALENSTIGVALASSGPGAINLISGIANAYYDSIPTLFITGNVSLNTMKRNDKVRQNAFQENDIVFMVSKVTKYAVTVKDAHELRFHMEKALFYALHGRPGPVLLDLPHNIQKVDLDFNSEKGITEIEDQEIDNYDDFTNEIITSLSKAKRPLFIIGGGATGTNTRNLIDRFLSKWHIPVVSTLRGLDVFSHKRNNYVGFGGAYGNRFANLAIKYSDLIIICGARLDERFICSRDNSIFYKKKIFHIDIDNIELGRVFSREIGIKSDINHFLTKLLAKEYTTVDFRKWNKTLEKWKSRFPSLTKYWSMNNAVHYISKNANDDDIFSIDIGINQMCVAQSISLNGEQRCYTSAGHGAMGCSIPMIIGAYYANKNKKGICFVGDGALHMNIQELLLIGRNKLPIHVILNNNNCLGMIRDYQTKAFSSSFVATVDLLEKIDYKKIADAYGLTYYSAKNEEELNQLCYVLKSSEPCLIELKFKKESDSNPKLGEDMFKQLPLLSEDEIDQIEKEAFECGNIISW